MLERVRNAIRDVDGFPKEGIVFKDITPILGDAQLFRAAIDLLCEIIAVSFLIELSFLKSREKLGAYPVKSFLNF